MVGVRWNSRRHFYDKQSSHQEVQRGTGERRKGAALLERHCALGWHVQQTHQAAKVTSHLPLPQTQPQLRNFVLFVLSLVYFLLL